MVETEKSNQVTDLALSLPSAEKMRTVWAEHNQRRNEFRSMLLAALIQGEDYGFPPGCECRYNENGDVLTFSKKRGSWVPIPKTQWRPVPCLYQRGALKIMDLFRMMGFPLRADFSRSVGSGGERVSVCKLVHIETGLVYGEGVGACREGERDASINTALQIADKRAMVAAVRRTYPCVADLFTQDLETKPSPANTVATANQSVSDDFKKMLGEWMKEIAESSGNDILALHTITPRDERGIKAALKLWLGDNMPATAAEAIKWLRSNATLVPVEDETGAIVGVSCKRAKEGV